MPETTQSRTRQSSSAACTTTPRSSSSSNVWDVASARVVASLPGCRAVATASHSIAAAHGYEDGEQIPLDLMLDTVGRDRRGRGPARDGRPRGRVRQRRQHRPPGHRGRDRRGEHRGRDAALRRGGRGDGGRREGWRGRGNPVLAQRAYGRASCWRGTATVQPCWRTPIARGRAFLEAGATSVFVPGRLDADTVVALVDAYGDRRLSVIHVPGSLPQASSNASAWRASRSGRGRSEWRSRRWPTSAPTSSRAPRSRRAYAPSDDSRSIPEASR